MYTTKRQLCISLLLLLSTFTTLAQNNPLTPSITANEQVISTTSVTIDEVISDNFGFVVIHAQDSEGNIGGIIGLSLIHAGVNRNISVELDMINVTATLYARIHLDTEPYGDFQFAQGDGADMPVMIDNDILTTEFTVAVISIHDQFIDPENFNRIVVDIAATEANGWLVAHAENTDGSIGEVLGQTYLPTGVVQDVPILLSGNVTATIFVVLHEDTFAPERYEFDEVDNADTPLLLNGIPAFAKISSEVIVRFDNQLAIGSDLTRNDSEFVPVVVDSVLSDGAGWLVIYADSRQDTALGFAPVQHGFNDNVIVQVPQAVISTQLIAVLHEDTGEALVYEFDTVENTDLPIIINESLVMDSAYITPYINEIATLDGNILTIQGATSDVTAWLVIYTENTNGILAYAPLNMGYNETIQVEIAEDYLTEPLFAMIHYDSRPIGVYEFDLIEGQDLPLIFEGNPIFVALIIE